MRGAAGPGDDDFEAASVSSAAEFEHVRGCAMGGKNLDVGVDAEFGAGFGGGFERGPIGVAAHDDGNGWRCVSAHVKIWLRGFRTGCWRRLFWRAAGCLPAMSRAWSNGPFCAMARWWFFH